MDFACGPAVIKMMTLIREAFRNAGALADVVYHIPEWLEKIGFTNIHVEMRRVSMRGEEGRVMRENNYYAYMGMKTPVLNAGGFGLVKSEAEYDILLEGYKDELVVTNDAAQLIYTIYAQKPSTVN